MDSGPISTENRMIWLLESSFFMVSTASAKAVLLTSNISAIGFPWTESWLVPMTSLQDGLTHRTKPSKPRSSMTFSVCSAASLRSSRSSRMSVLVVLSIGPLSWNSAPSCRRAVTTGGARNVSFFLVAIADRSRCARYFSPPSFHRPTPKGSSWVPRLHVGVILSTSGRERDGPNQFVLFSRLLQWPSCEADTVALAETSLRRQCIN